MLYTLCETVVKEKVLFLKVPFHQAFPLSSEKTMIDPLIFRLETYPQDGGTRPFVKTTDPELLIAPGSQLVEQRLKITHSDYLALNSLH